jgi:hypothetical protein
MVPAAQLDGPGGLRGVRALLGRWYGAILGADHEGRGNLTPGHSTHRLPECQQGLRGGSGERFGDSVVVAVAEKQLSQLIRAQDCGAARLRMHPRHRAGVSGVRVRLTQVRQCSTDVM